MANLSNINGKFVVEQTTGYVGVGTTDPNFPIEVLNASAEIALNASGASIYRLRSDSTDAFRINKNGVGDRFVIQGDGKIQVNSDKVIWAGGYGGGLVIRKNNATSDRLIKMVTVDSTGAIALDNVLVAKGSSVGIGTDSPLTTLHVNQANDAQVLVQGTNKMALHQDAAWNSNILLGCYYDGSNIVYGTTNRGAFKIVGLHDTTTQPQTLSIYGASGAAAAGSTVTFNSVGFSQDEDGNVGIGTTSPTLGKLQVAGSGYFGPVGTGDATTKAEMQSNAVLRLKPHDNNSTNMNFAQVNGGGGIGIQTTNGPGTANWDIALSPFGGKVGIGTVSPNKALTVYGGNDNGIWIDSQGAQYTSLAFGNNGTEKANIAWDNTNGYTNITTYGNGHLALATGGSISAFLNSSGNFGIGDTAPTSISINTSSLSVGSTRGDLSGGLISKANGNVKHQQYWDSSGYSFNITSNSGVFKFNGADVQVNANIKANNVDGKIYSMAASWAYVASKNDLFSFAGTEGALWEYTIKMNPNSAGSGAYRDFYYGKLGIGMGWNGSNVTQYIWQQQDQTAPRTLYGSGGGNFNPLFRMYYSGGIYTDLAYGTAWTLRIQGLSTTTYGDIFFRRLA